MVGLNNFVNNYSTDANTPHFNRRREQNNLPNSSLEKDEQWYDNNVVWMDDMKSVWLSM